MKKDLVIGLVGTAILVTAMVGVFRFEAAQAGSAFAIAWPEESVVLAAEEGRTIEGQETVVALAVNRTNVTRIEFALTWTDDVAQSAPDTFELVVVGPDGTEYPSQPGSEGKVVVFADRLALRPEGIQVNARNAERAEADLAPRYTSTAAMGAWNVTVRMVSAGDQNAPVGDLTIAQDDGNDWTLTTTLTTYRAKASSA